MNLFHESLESKRILWRKTHHIVIKIDIGIAVHRYDFLSLEL